MIRTSDEGAVRTITLDRPDSLNSLTQGMLHDLKEALVDSARDPGVRTIVLAGAGRGFCAGHDLSGGDDFKDPMAERYADDPVWMASEQLGWRLIDHAQIFILLHRMTKPTIASIRGPAAGSGFVLATACDLRIVSETAVLRMAFANAARCGDPGAAYLLSHIVGSAKAREIFLLDPKLSAAETLAMGLASKVVSDGELEIETMAIAQRLAEGPALAYAGIKRNLNAAETASLEETIYAEAVSNVNASFSRDGKEAAMAFVEKRKPVFRGY